MVWFVEQSEGQRETRTRSQQSPWRTRSKAPTRNEGALRHEPPAVPRSPARGPGISDWWHPLHAPSAPPPSGPFRRPSHLWTAFWFCPWNVALLRSWVTLSRSHLSNEQNQMTTFSFWVHTGLLCAAHSTPVPPGHLCLEGWVDASPVGSCSPSTSLLRPRAALLVPAHRRSPARPETVASTSTSSGHSVSDSKWLNQLRAVGERGPGSGRVTPGPSSLSICPRTLAGHALAVLPKPLLEAPGWDRSCPATRPRLAGSLGPRPSRMG